MNNLSPKEKRTVKYDLNILFSIKHYSIPKTIEDYKQLGFRSPHLKVKGREIYLDVVAQSALRRTTEVVMKTGMLEEFATFNDLWQLIKSHIEMWFEEMLLPDVDEFFDRLLPALAEFKKARRFIYRVEGLELKGVDAIELGDKTIHRQFSWDLLEGVESGDANRRERIEKEFGGQCIIEGREVGSHDKTQRKFVFGAEMAISVLRLCGCLLYRGAITHTHIRLVDRSLGAHGAASSLSWDEEERRLRFTRYWGKERPLTLSLDMLQYVTEHCFLSSSSNAWKRKTEARLRTPSIGLSIGSEKHTKTRTTQ